MRPQAIVIIAALLVVAAALLSIGPKGYEKLGEMQSLAAQTAAIREEFPEVEHISPETLSFLAGTKLIVDVRSPEEFEISHLEGALNYRSAAEIQDHLESLSTPPDLIVAYGSVGKRSAELTEELLDAGHTEVRNLAGSIFQWANEDRPLVDADGNPATKVHSAVRYQKLLLDPERRADPDPE